MQFSKIYHTQRTDVTWGGYSLVNAELLLLKAALNVGGYDYYHLISGADLPIKSQDEIHAFFEQYQGKEFVGFDNDKFKYSVRVHYWHLFQDYLGRPTEHPILGKINTVFIYFQRILGLKRNRNIEFQKGTQWFSITEELANYLVSQEMWIKKVFKYTFVPDEVFVQTIVYNSEFRRALYNVNYNNSMHSTMRLIDWNRGNPYTWRLSDMEEIKHSDLLFARKFDELVDAGIILEVVNMVKNRRGRHI
jgi:hypothetical protein